MEKDDYFRYDGCETRFWVFGIDVTPHKMGKPSVVFDCFACHRR